jgi:hypothetical protein
MEVASPAERESKHEIGLAEIAFERDMDYGRPIQFADEIAELSLEHGFDTFVIGETQEDVETELREFLENVAPKVRELVAQGRA